MGKRWTVELTLPEAWVSEDGVLFMRSHIYRPMRDVFEAGNKALEEQGYDERIGHNNFRPPYPRVWVDPFYVGAEQWSASAVSREPVEGWVSLFRSDVDDLVEVSNA